MPWTTDKNGEPVYKLSIYAKEELPTWSEVYEEFYQKKQFNYDPLHPRHQYLDLYWKIPRRIYLISTVCNQFNKMLFEENMRHSLMQVISKNFSLDCTDVRFSCIPSQHDNLDISILAEDRMRFMFFGTDDPPPIFTFPLPSGKVNPFAISKNQRIDVTSKKWHLCLYPMIQFQDDNHFITLEINPYDDHSLQDYKSIIDFMMKPFKEYFEGSGVGWKDKDGNLLESDPLKRSCNGAGYDPAL